MRQRLIQRMVEDELDELNCFDIEENLNVFCFSDIDSSELSSDVVNRKVGEGWKVVATGEKVDLEKLKKMDEVNEWSYPYKLKRDLERNFDPVLMGRLLSKKSVKYWENLSQEKYERFCKFISFWSFGRKLAPETIEKIRRTKKFKKKYLMKVVPREVNFSGVRFE